MSTTRRPPSRCPVTSTHTTTPKVAIRAEGLILTTRPMRAALDLARWELDLLHWSVCIKRLRGAVGFVREAQLRLPRSFRCGPRGYRPAYTYPSGRCSSGW